MFTQICAEVCIDCAFEMFECTEEIFKEYSSEEIKSTKLPKLSQHVSYFHSVKETYLDPFQINCIHKRPLKIFDPGVLSF